MWLQKKIRHQFSPFSTVVVIVGSGIQDKHTGNATLKVNSIYAVMYMATELCKKNCLLPELHPRKMSLDQQIGLHVGVVELGGLKLVGQP